LAVFAQVKAKREDLSTGFTCKARSEAHWTALILRIGMGVVPGGSWEIASCHAGVRARRGWHGPAVEQFLARLAPGSRSSGPASICPLGSYGQRNRQDIAARSTGRLNLSKALDVRDCHSGRESFTTDFGADRSVHRHGGHASTADACTASAVLGPGGLLSGANRKAHRNCVFRLP
jgi:hypothetical protein